MADMRETEKMAIIPLPNAGGKEEPKEDTKEDKGEMLKAGLASIESGFMVDAILTIYAGQHAASPAVKNFAKSFGRESAKARSTFKELCSKNQLTLPLKLTSAHESALGNLKGKRKADFDKAYNAFIEQMLEDRKEVLYQLKSAETAPDLKEFAGSYAATVEKWYRKKKASR